MKQFESLEPRKHKHYKGTALQLIFQVFTVYTVHYFEYSCDYVFKGEKHDFWEMMFVDNGSVQVTAGEHQRILEKGDVIMHAPSEFHSFRAMGKNPPNLIVVSFDCDSPYMEQFRHAVIRADEGEIQLFGRLIEESQNAFAVPTHNPLTPRYDAPFGSEQIFKITLELLLISLYRRCQKGSTYVNPSSDLAAGNHARLVEQVTVYLQDRLYQNLTVTDICRDNSISRSLLQRVFHEHKGCGVIEYFNRMKIDAAKKLIRENRYTFSQIASMLNYSSYQYFSLQFKKYARMSPSEYHSSSRHFH